MGLLLVLFACRTCVRLCIGFPLFTDVPAQVHLIGLDNAIVLAEARSLMADASMHGNYSPDPSGTERSLSRLPTTFQHMQPRFVGVSKDEVFLNFSRREEGGIPHSLILLAEHVDAQRHEALKDRGYSHSEEIEPGIWSQFYFK